MRRFHKIAAGVTVLGSVLMVAPVMAEDNDRRAGRSARGQGGVDSNSRLAAVIGMECVPVRTKGVEKVRHPSVGVCCITPDPEINIKVKRIVPNVTVNWYYSSGDDLMAFYSSSGRCRKREIEVRTYDLQGVSSDNVGFNINVP